MDVDVVIAGGGPTGLMLAAELRLAGLDPVVLERLPEISEIPKGNGLVGQIVPMLDYRGLRESFAAGSTWVGPIPQFSFGPLTLDLSKLGVSPLHILAIPQRRLERLLDERVRHLGGTVRRGHELTALSQDDEGVTLDVAGPEGGYRLRTRYLVGCDGAHSFVRKQAGIGFPGVTSSERPARPVLLDLTPDSALAGVAALWRHRVNLVAARLVDPSTPASGLLIRPDGYVAWAAGPGEPDQTDALKQALRAWFGPPETAVVAVRDP